MPEAACAGLVTQSGPRHRVASGGGGGGDNPDGLAAGTILQTRTLSSVNTSNDGPVQDGSPELTTWTHDSTGSWGGDGSYNVSISQNGGTVGVEQQQGKGLKWWPLSQPAVDEVQVFCLQYYIKFSQIFIDECMKLHTDPERQSEVPPPGGPGNLGGYLWGGGKTLDFYGYNAGGTDEDASTRQVIGITPVRTVDTSGTYSPTGVNAQVGLFLSAQNLGAGGAMVDDGTNDPYDFSPYADVWHCVNIYASCVSGSERTAIYVKRQGGPTMTKSVDRLAGMQNGNSTGANGYVNRGWCFPDMYNSFLWNYWQGIRHAHTPAPEIDLGGPITISTGWITPGF